MSFLVNITRSIQKSLPLLQKRTIRTSAVTRIQITPILWAEPLKKKKKIDPQIIKQREERRRKKLQKQIRKLEKNSRQLKPIDELEVPLDLIDEKEIRTRANIKITAEIQDERDEMHREWARYKHKQKIADYQIIDRVLMAQEKALEQLRLESEELYTEAIQPDLMLVPFQATGPLSTPPIKDYESPDGEYFDITKKYV